ncbi:TPA: hypothetical protein ACM99T_000651 [Escherichia coli]
MKNEFLAQCEMQFTDLIVGLQTVVNEMLDSPDELHVFIALKEAETVQAALEALIETCSEAENLAIEATDLEQVNIILKDVASILSEACADIQNVCNSLMEA